MRNVLIVKTMGPRAKRSSATESNEEKESGSTSLSAGDTYRLLTIIGAVLLVPFAAIAEGGSCLGLWQAVSEGSMAKTFLLDVARRALLAAVCFNLFYDLTFRLLGQLHPVTHAVGNAVKRVVVIGAGAAAFGGGLGGVRGAFGSALTVAGVLSYSVAKAKCRPTSRRHT